VRAWARSARVGCEDARADLVTCAHVPAAAGTIDELALAFDAQGRLVNVTTLRTHMGATAAAAAAHAIAVSLGRELGPPTTSGGAFDGAHLAEPGVAGLASISYRFSDYVADVTAMNLPHSGSSVREHYMSAD
jgi:hypothetical protein